MLNSATTTANQLPGPPHYVDLHVNPGESVSIQFFDGNETVLRGPTTIKMISQHAYPPMPLPVQVPPGHMIQQIVDEHGTLKHIILSALNTPSGALNASAVISNPQQPHHLQQYCCCCNNSCGTAAQPVPNAPTSANATNNAVAAAAGTHLAAAFANQMLQQPGSTMAFPPLSHSPAATYPRNRRSARNYSSPNKRSSYDVHNSTNNNYYYSTSPGISKGSGNRYSKISSQSDNPKLAAHNRYNANSGMHYDHHHHQHHRSSIYDQTTTTTNTNNHDKYLNHNNNNTKSYDNSYSSHISQTSSTLDQVSENLKYYKNHHHHHDQYGVAEDGGHTYANKKTFNNLNLEPTNLYLADYTPEEEDNLIADVENMSQKSSLSESVDTNELSQNRNEDADDVQEVADFMVDDVKKNNQKNDDKSNRDLKAYKTSEQTVTKDQTKDKGNNDRLPAICESNDSNFETNQTKKDQKTSNSTQPIIVLDEIIDDDDDDETNDILLEVDTSNEKTFNNKNSDNQYNVMEANDEKNYWSNVSTIKSLNDNDKNKNGKLSMANGHLDRLLDLPDSNSGSEPIETDKTESDSDENDNQKDQSVSSSQSRSPKHLLPKIEALTLSCTNVKSSSANLKWQFNQPDEQQNNPTKQKRHYIVDLSLNNQSNEDNCSTTRMAYQGPNTSCRVNHLQAQHEYTFRVRTSTETSWLVSNILNVLTPESTPGSFNKSGRRTNKQLHQQLTQQQQLILHQQQQLQQQQQNMEQEKQKQQQSASTSANDLLNPVGVVVSTDQGYALILVTVFTIISLIIAVIINHALGNQW